MKREFVRYLQGRETDTLAVATILQTKGSTPRKAGTTMVVHPDGSILVRLVAAEQKMKFGLMP